MRTESGKPVGGRASDSAVGNVAHDRHSLAAKVAEVSTKCEQIEQPLRGMLMPTIASIHHRALHIVRHERSAARDRAAHDKHINPHRLYV